MGRRLLRAVGTASATVTMAFGLLELALPAGGGAGTYATASAAIVLAAAAAGLFAGLLAVALSCVVIVYAHLPPLGELHVDRVDELLGLAMFAVSGLVVAAVGSLARQGLARPLRVGLLPPVATGKPVEPAPPTLPIAPPWSQRRPGRAAALVEPLTAREVEVLTLLAEGMSNEDIAASLYLSINTVKTHLKNVYGKLEVTSRTRAAARAQELGVIGAPGRSEEESDERPAA